MRVGIDAVPFAFEYTGVQRYLNGILDEMQTLAPATELLLYTPVPVDVPLRDGNWRVRMAPDRLSPRPSVWIQRTLPGLLASDRVDAFWGQPTNLPVRLRRGCFRLLTLHDLVPYVCPESMRLRTWSRMRLLLPLVATAADMIVADSRATAALARRFVGVGPHKVRVVYPAAPETFRPVPKAEADEVVSKEFGLPKGYILSVGTIEPRKDHLTLLRALALVPRAPQLVLVGGVGWRCRQILAAIRAHEQAGRVRFLGRVADRLLPALYSAATLSVYPSLHEGFGMPVLEAMACGCPVLCSRSSSLPEVGADAARYFRTGDSADLADKLRELLADEKQRRAMVTAGLERAKQFSFRQAAREILDIMRAGVARPRRDSRRELASLPPPAPRRSSLDARD